MDVINRYRLSIEKIYAEICYQRQNSKTLYIIIITRAKTIVAITFYDKHPIVVPIHIFQFLNPADSNTCYGICFPNACTAVFLDTLMTLSVFCAIITSQAQTNNHGYKFKCQNKVVLLNRNQKQ